MCIRFSRCGLTSRGAASLGEMLQDDKHLTSLRYGNKYLACNNYLYCTCSIGFEKIGDNGVKYLADAMATNDTLTELK